jgi:hypothetical protein
MRYEAKERQPERAGALLEAPALLPSPLFTNLVEGELCGVHIYRVA